MTDPPVNRKLSAILSADAVGYSRLMGDNDAATVETLKEYRVAMRRVIERHKGRVVNTPGDALLAEFPSAVEAVECAVEIQKALGGRNVELSPDRRMEFRIGVNLGDVIEEDDGTIYGDGVNIAARMESLADAGGICISSPVFDTIEGKVNFGFDFLGAQKVKNISKPINVYRVRSEPGEHLPRKPSHKHSTRLVAIGAGLAVLLVVVTGLVVWQFAGSSREPAPVATVPEPVPGEQQDIAAVPIPERSIVVLPFKNLIGDTTQDHIADGITEAIITGLSSAEDLSVIARNTAFAYKGQAVRVGQLSRELGVRYVVEGSVQKIGDRVRITAQLVEAPSGGHIWSNQYDSELSGIFALQDQLTQSIVAALKPDQAAEPLVVVSEPPALALDAYDLALRANQALGEPTEAANMQAAKLFAQSIEMDPEYADAYVGLGRAHLQRWQQGWSRDPSDLDRALELGQKAKVLDPWFAPVYALLGQAHLWRGEYGAAIETASHAVELDPSNADVNHGLAQILNFSGQPEESIALVEKAMRLNPRYPWVYAWTLGLAAMVADRPAAAIAAFEQTVEKKPGFVDAHALLAMLYAESGRADQAEQAYQSVLDLAADFTHDALRSKLPFRSKAPLERIQNGLIALGAATD